MVKVLCLIDSLVAGGAQHQLVCLAILLKQNGYVVKVVTYHDIPFYLPKLQENDVDYECIKCGRNPIQRLLKIRRIVKDFSPEVVISYLDTPNMLACIMKLFGAKWKLIASERNTTQTLGKKETLKFSLYKFSDYIVPNSFSQGKFIISNFPRYEKKVRVITNFVDIEEFSPKKGDSNKDVLRIIGVGRIAKQKNIPLLIDAVKEVINAGYKVQVDWYGNIFESYDECMELIEKYDLTHCFHFHKPYSPIVDKYRESNLFVLPSFYEGYPNVVCEAMSCGVPVIASDICDNGLIVKEGLTGYLFESDNKQQLVECILNYINLTEEEKQKMSTEGRKVAIKMFSSKCFVNKYIDLIEGREYEHN